MSESSSQVVLITGSNTGIGFETVRALLASSKLYDVILCSRSLERAQAAVSELEAEVGKNTLTALQLDIEDDKSIDSAVDTVEKKFGRLDVLVNNAGAAFDMIAARGGMPLRDAWTKAYNLNVTSTHFVTSAFVPLLVKSQSPRIIFVSSDVSSFTDALNTAKPHNQSPPAGWPKPPTFSIPAYRSSKTATNMMAREWYRVLLNDGVLVLIAQMGRYATGFGGVPKEQKVKMGIEDASTAGQYTTDLIEGKWDAYPGVPISIDGPQPW